MSWANVPHLRLGPAKAATTNGRGESLAMGSVGARRGFWKPPEKTSLFDPPDKAPDTPGKGRVTSERYSLLPLESEWSLSYELRASLLKRRLQGPEW